MKQRQRLQWRRQSLMVAAGAGSYRNGGVAAITAETAVAAAVIMSRVRPHGKASAVADKRLPNH
jgi:hypothetical protein